MAYNLMGQSGQFVYKVNQYVIDTDADVDMLPVAKSDVAPGSTALVTTTGNQYILNNDYQWVLLQSGGEDPTQKVHYIWDGGEVE